MKSVHFPQYGGVGSEQQLVQDLVDEQIKLYGMDVFYLPRDLLIDRALNDIILSRFKQHYMVEMMLLNTEGFGGAGAVSMSKFGLALTDEMTLAVSKRRWQSFVQTKIRLKVPSRPNEGDLIYVPMTKNTYEIKFVEREVPFYQLGKNYIYSLSCELMQNANTEFDTGIDELDNLDQESYGFWVTLNTGGTGSYIEGEEVTQTYTPNEVSAPVTVTATVADWQPLQRKVKLVYLKGTGNIKTGVPLIGGDSGASWIPGDLSTLDIDVKNTRNSENKYYEDAGDLIIDFTEGNPFGEFGDMEDSF